MQLAAEIEINLLLGDGVGMKNCRLKYILLAQSCESSICEQQLGALWKLDIGNLTLLLY